MAFQNNIIDSIDWLYILIVIGFGLFVRIQFSLAAMNVNDCKHDYSVLSDFITFLFAVVVALSVVYLFGYDPKLLFVFWNSIMVVVSFKVLFAGAWVALKQLYGLYQRLK